MLRKSRRAPRRHADPHRKRRLSIESLEIRMMLDAGGLPLNLLGSMQVNSGQRLTVDHLVVGACRSAARPILPVW